MVSGPPKPIVDDLFKRALGEVLAPWRAVISRQREFVLSQVQKLWPSPTVTELPFAAEWREGMWRYIQWAMGVGRRHAISRLRARLAERRAWLARHRVQETELRQMRRVVALRSMDADVEAETDVAGWPTMRAHVTEELVGSDPDTAWAAYRNWIATVQRKAFRDTVEKSQGAIRSAILEGATLEDYSVYREDGTREKRDGLLTQLKSVFSDAQGYELERKATTEFTRAVNLGAVTEYRNDPMTRAVRFSAVMDLATSDICKMMNGTVFDITDPRIGRFSPPLHGNCRSLLEPITIMDADPVTADLEREWVDKTSGLVVTFRPSQIRTDFKTGVGEQNINRSAAPTRGPARTQDEAIADFMRLHEQLKTQDIVEPWKQ